MKRFLPARNSFISCDKRLGQAVNHFPILCLAVISQETVTRKRIIIPVLVTTVNLPLPFPWPCNRLTFGCQPPVYSSLFHFLTSGWVQRTDKIHQLLQHSLSRTLNRPDVCFLLLMAGKPICNRGKGKKSPWKIECFSVGH